MGKKILVLSSHTPSLFIFRKDMIKAFLEAGHEVVAVGNEAEQDWVNKFAEMGVKYRQTFIQRNGTNPLKDLKTWKDLKKLIKEERPDKIFSYQAKTVIYGGLAARSRKNVEYYPLIAGIGSVFLGSGLKNKIVRAILKTEYKLALKKSKNVFFQNSDDVETFKNNRLIKAEKVVMLNGSGVNLDDFILQELPNSSTFLCVSRLIRDKGVAEYLEAAKLVKSKYPNARFLLVGPFDTNPSALKEADLKPYVESGAIEYCGEQKDVRPYLAQCSVYVLPSYREGTPKSVLEAMACGKAIITTDAPGCKETVVSGENGFLVPVKDAESLAEKMTYLIENPQTVQKMAGKSRRIAEEKFDVKKVNEVILNTMGL